MVDENRSDRTLAILPWLFPLTYLLHIAEEYWGGGGFSAYMARTRGVNLPPTRFLLMNGIGLGLMIVGVVLARRLRFTHWLLACFGAVVVGNGLSHTVNSVATREYNPGLVTGLLIWIPLGLLTLFYLKGRMARRRFWAAMVIGVGILLVVMLLTLSGGNPLSLLRR
jgi:Protein of unknown function with HXXEE motif